MISLRRSNERGHANHGWLESYHTFSFADFHDTAFMGFRCLRVINEDQVAGGQGFGTHPHRDFEIISYVISGALKHSDSMGRTAVMEAGDFQRISAGTGIAHSEFNASLSEPVHFLQIWLVPSRKGFPPDYAQRSFSGMPPSALTLACSQDGRADSISINQDADIFIGRLDAGETVTHNLKADRHGWVQVIGGDINLNGQPLKPGDGAAVDNESALQLHSKAGAHFLLFDLN